MKLNRYLRIHILLLLLVPFLLAAQDNRSAKTKVADLLALLPATDSQQANRLFQELIGFGDEGLMILTDGVVPNGMIAGTPFRYGVSLLTRYATTEAQKQQIERAYLAALGKADDAEVKAYFMDNLKLVGSNVSVKTLAAYAGDKGLSDKAISTLVSIGTQDACQGLTTALDNEDSEIQARVIKGLGTLRYLPALPLITKYASSDNTLLKRHALWSIALIADASSNDELVRHAKNTGFRNDPTEATNALVEYMHQMTSKGNRELVKGISKVMLANTVNPDQQHFRLAALDNLAEVDAGASVKLLIKETSRFDAEYRKEVLKIAASTANTPEALKLWQKAYKKSTGSAQADIFTMLTRANEKEGFVEGILVQGLASPNQELRIAAAAEIARRGNRKMSASLLSYLLRSKEDVEIEAGKAALLQLADKDIGSIISPQIETAQPINKVALLQILGQRRAVDQFNVVAKQTASADAAVRDAAFDALSYVSSGSNVDALLKMLATTTNTKDEKAIQAAIISALDRNSIGLVNDAYQKDKIKLLPVLPYLDDSTALTKVVSTFYHGNPEEKETAFEAMENWQDNRATRTLLAICKNKDLEKYHNSALLAYVKQVSKSTWPDDQKLLMLREMMTLAADNKEKVTILSAAGNVRTFLSLMFVADYLDDPGLSSAASRSAMQIALPTSDAKPGLTGIEVRNTLVRMLDKLTGADSQYERIDILTYLESLPHTKGFESIFNGKDLAGWQGLVENPIARSKMSKDELARKQKEANGKISENWRVKDGCIYFEGEGANLCTTRLYGDFEMLVDWKISKNGDSGIYLRGSPQVQIWDIARTEDGAQVGSGGLYNNTTARSTPLVVADNPIGEWNTFHIKMIGDRVTVHLNGVLVVDNVVMENYWDRNLPIFPEEAIELQAHGTALAFRNIYVKTLDNKPYQITEEEKDHGFEVLFNGKDLDNWVGNKTDYVVEDNAIAIYPTNESHGNLYTEKEYEDFIFRFEFQLTPGSNNGVGIHAPLEGDAAYVGKEIQVIDNTAPVWADLQPWQYHGSVYGIIPAKRGFLKPVGDWNQEEIYVKGDYIKVTLNGTVILEGDIKKATKNGTLDHKEHPGLERHTGHIGFLGHGSIVRFRSIRVKDLSK